MRRKIELVLSIAVGGGFLFLAFKDIEFKQFWASLAEVSWVFVALLCLMTLIAMVLRAWRWRILLAPVKVIPPVRVFNYTMIGFMANNILPAHMGELVRAYLIGEKEQVSKISTLTTVIIERLFDFAILTLFLLATLVFVEIPGWLKYGGILIGVLSFVLILICFVLARRQGFPGWLNRLLERFPKTLQGKIHDKLDALLNGLGMMNGKGVLAKVVVISLVVWLQIVATLYLALMAFHFQVDLLMASILLMVLIAFSITIPSTPGYFGNMQLAFVIGLGLVGVSKTDALACSLVYHFTQYIPITLVGILVFVREGLSLGTLLEKIQKRKIKDPSTAG